MAARCLAMNGAFHAPVAASAAEHSEGPHSSDALEVIVVVEEKRVVLKRDLGDEAIKATADGQSLATAVEEDSRSLPIRPPGIARGHDVESMQHLVEEAPVFLVARTLPDLHGARNRHSVRHAFVLECSKPLDSGCGMAAERRHQHGRVNEDHVPARSFL